MKLAACAATMDYAERLTRAGIATIPEGVYRFTDRFDCDEFPGELELGVTVEVEGGDLRFCFTSPPQMRNSRNVVWTGLLAKVYYAVRTLVGPAIPANAGPYRPIRVEAEPGALLNSETPAAVDGRTQTCQRSVDLIHGSLAPAVPGRVTAAHNGANASFDF